MAVLSDVSVYIGRFNPFHLGHAHVLSYALRTSKLVIVLVGSSGQARSLKNPFSFEERKTMIQDWALDWAPKSTQLVVLPLYDHPYNDTFWIESVQNIVQTEVNAQVWDKPPVITVVGSNRDDSTWYLSSFPQWGLSLVNAFGHSASSGAPNLSATSIREMMYTNSIKSHDDGLFLLKVPKTTQRFLNKFITTDECALLRREYEHVKQYKASWKAAPYAPIFVTTDSIVIQSGHVLIVERGAFPGKGLWALPGGFLNQNERLKEGAIRELMEETGILLADGKRAKDLTRNILRGSIIAKEIFDKPDRSSRGRTITTAFLYRLDDTKPLPQVKGQNAPLSETGGRVVVETAKAFWLPVSVALSRSEMWFEDHHGILEHMMSHGGN